MTFKDMLVKYCEENKKVIIAFNSKMAIGSEKIVDEFLFNYDVDGNICELIVDVKLSLLKELIATGFERVIVENG